LSSRKLLTVAGSAVPVGPLPEFVYVREYVPPVISGLVQQLSLAAPQSVIPLPPGAQLGGCRQLPADEHVPDPLQLLPLFAGLHVVVLVAGWQLWHALLGFAVPDA